MIPKEEEGFNMQGIITTELNPFSIITQSATAVFFLLFFGLILWILLRVVSSGRGSGNRKGFLIISFSFFLIFFSLGPGLSDSSPQDYYFTNIPVIEEISLAVDGSITDQKVSTTQDWDIINRLVGHMEFHVNNLDLDDFANLSTSLTNGIQLFATIDGINHSLINGDTIKTTDDWSHASYDYRLLIDEIANPKAHVVLWRFSFDKFTPIGLNNNSGQITEIFAVVQDDLTGIGELSLTFEGSRVQNHNYFSVNQPEKYNVNTKSHVELFGLEINEEYSILFNTSDHSQWTNFTAYESNYIIQFVVDEALSENDEIMTILLYKNDVKLEQSFMLIIDDQLDLLEWIAFNWIEIVGVMIVIIILLGLFGIIWDEIGK